jgi:hypothetical protein
MCQSKDEGGRRCPDGRRFMKSSFTTADLVPQQVPGRPSIKWRSESLDAVKEQWPTSYVCATCKTLERHSAAEPQVTDAMERALPPNAHLEGLEYRMKSPASICGKIDRKQQDAVDLGADVPTAEAVAGRMKDVLRYTFVTADHDSVTDAVTHVAAQLSRDGWTITEAENMFVSGNSYKGLHLTATNSDSLSVEVQIHSQESIDTKNQIHKLYEEMRDTGTSPARRRELHDEMVSLSDALSTPRGLEKLTTLEDCEVREIKR